MEALKGRIIRGIGGFYYVATEHGIIECHARGKFRKDNIIPIVGDFVEIQTSNFKDGYILKIEKRKNFLIRPPVANVDKAVIVFSITNPEINTLLLDKMIVMAEERDIEPIICINKIDLQKDCEHQEILNIYKNIGYKTVGTSILKNEGIDILKNILKDYTSFFAGPSGVGKSSLINAIIPGSKLKTGEISEKLLKGKHTTRNVELLSLDSGGFILDTPGFSSLKLNIKKEDLRFYFKEFLELQDKCKFNSCLHTSEPGCNIIKSVENGIINKKRYENYITILNELEEYYMRRY
ncbi:MAG: ribosome small subunit-dependent GTPase A [Thermoanaerobacteraceae bacterium]